MRRRAWLITTTLIAATLSSSGCVTLMGGEERVGAAAHQQVEASMGLVQDPKLVAYVTEIGERLVKHASRQDVTWRFYVVDMPEPNAFALPGGYIYVSRGLLALVNKEDELAGVIGHEIGHVTAGHGNKRITFAAPFAIVTGISGWATGIVSPKAGEAIANADQLVVAPFSRSQEREADRIGAELSAGAGWDPNGLGDFLVTLGRFVTVITGEERRASWLDSHPPSPERAEALRDFVPTLERGSPNPVAANQADLFGRLDGLILGPDAAAGVEVGPRFVHPELGWSIRFPVGWSVANTPTAVGAQEPGGSAAVVMQIAATDRSLDDLVVEVQEEDSRLQIAQGQVSGLPSAHTTVNQGGHTIDVTWIEHGGNVYKIGGVTRRNSYETWTRVFRETTKSFRNAQADEISKIRERRLRIATTGSGESLAALLKRVGSVWEKPVARVANGLEDGAAPAAGSLVKYGRKERYSPRR